MKKILTAALAISVALLTVGCDSPTDATTIDVDLSASPDPATAVESQGLTYDVINADDTVTTLPYQYKTTFTVTATEQEGHACDVTAVSASVQQASGGIVVTTSKTIYQEYGISASGNELPANGSLATVITVYYTLPSKGKEALITVSMSFRDDDGYTASASVQVRVEP